MNWSGPPRLVCILNLDSPSYPPELDEFRQCGCKQCRIWYAQGGVLPADGGIK